MAGLGLFLTLIGITSGEVAVGVAKCSRFWDADYCSTTLNFSSVFLVLPIYSELRILLLLFPTSVDASFDAFFVLRRVGTLKMLSKIPSRI